MSLSTSQTNILFSDELYAKFVREFVKKHSKMESKGSFHILNHKNEKHLLSDSGHFIGFVPKEIHDISDSIINEKTLAFFMQPSISYSRFEIQSIKLKDIFTRIARENEIELSPKEARNEAQAAILNLVRDFIL